MPEGDSILIIDDESSVGRSLSLLLSREGYEVTAVESGNEGLERLEDRDFDLVLTDVVMPDIDGFKVMDYLKGHRPQTPVIVITGYASLESAIESVRRGALDYLVKPFDLGLMQAAVERALETQRARRSKYERLYDAVADAIFVTDFTGKILEVNREACRLLGYERAELLRFSLSQLQPGNLLPAFKKALFLMVAGRSLLIETELVAKDGQVIQGELHGRRVEEEAEILQFVVRDTNFRKEATRQLVQREKWRALHQMVQGLANSFNDILTIILGRAQLALKSTEDPELRLDLKAIERSARRAAEELKRLQELTRDRPDGSASCPWNLTRSQRH